MGWDGTYFHDEVQHCTYRDFGMALLQGFKSRLAVSQVSKYMDLDPIDEQRAETYGWPHITKSPSLSPLYVSIGGDKSMGPFGGLDSVNSG